MLLKINKVLKAKTSGKEYAKTVLGKVMFAAPEVELKEGNWAVVTTTVQTMRKAGAGETGDAKGLIHIPATEAKPVLNIVQAIFATKDAAIDAIMEEQSGDTSVIAAMQAVVKDFSMDDLKALAGSAI